MDKLLGKILWTKQKPGQIALAGLGFVAGFFILLLSIQVYFQINRVLEPVKSGSDAGDFIIINKSISLANTLRLSNSGFTQAELDEVKKQPFVKKMGLFVANQFQSYAKSSTTIPFGTVMFFEAVPNEYLDQHPSDFEWHPGSDFLPIMLSQDFLNLYNFGFALSQGLPQLSRQAIQMVPLEIELTGPQGKKNFKSRIVGFSDRFSTVLVPANFMDWANKNLGENKTQMPSRLVVQVSNASDPAITSFLEQKGYQTNADKLRTGKAGAIIKMVMALIGGIGVLFIGLSVLVFSTGFRALLAESKNEIMLLIQLGYTGQTIATSLLKRFYIFISVLAIFAFGLAWFSSLQIQSFILKQGLGTNIGKGLFLQAIVPGLLFLLAAIVFNTVSVANIIKRIQ